MASTAHRWSCLACLADDLGSWGNLGGWVDPQEIGLWMRQRLQSRAKNWPYAYGTVEHAEPKMIGEGRAAHWVGELSYSYSVDGDYYSRFYHLPASGGDQASRWVQGWKDRGVVVHYAPGNPSQSVLIVEEQNQPSGTIAPEIGLR